MKTASPSLRVAVALLAAAAFAATAIAQAPQTEPSTTPDGQAPQTEPAPTGPGAMADRPHREMPAPTNLQVLPKDLTGEQVHHIMEGWAAALGTHCDTCHAPNPNATAQPGKRPRLDFALDIKPEKNTARLMVKMVEDINTNYIAMVKNSGVKVSCGTCHRGHLSPPAFKSDEHREGPPPGAPGAERVPEKPPVRGL